MFCEICGAPECTQHRSTTPAEIEAVEAKITELRMEEASINRRRNQLQAELADLVERLPTEKRLKWFSHAWSRGFSTG